MISLSAPRTGREVTLGRGVTVTIDLSDYDVVVAAARHAAARTAAQLVKRRAEAGGAGDWGIVPVAGDLDGARGLSEALAVREIARRLVRGWSGVAEDCTPDNAAELVRRFPDLGQALVAAIGAAMAGETAEGNA